LSASAPTAEAGHWLFMRSVVAAWALPATAMDASAAAARIVCVKRFMITPLWVGGAGA